MGVRWFCGYRVGIFIVDREYSWVFSFLGYNVFFNICVVCFEKFRSGEGYLRIRCRDRSWVLGSVYSM